MFEYDGKCTVSWGISSACQVGPRTEDTVYLMAVQWKSYLNTDMRISGKAKIYRSKKFFFFTSA